MEPWIIDTDAGVDDAQALVIALKHPEIFNLAAITVLGGNVPLQQAARNVAEVLRVCGREDVPYYCGAERPLINHPNGAELYHGADGLHGYWEAKHGDTLPTLKAPEPLHAVYAIVNAAKQNKALNIVTIGPLTNLALALVLDPSLADKLNRVVIMGGSVHSKGNTTPVAEYNIHEDPEAAHIVFERVKLIEVVSWECSDNSRHKFDDSFLQLYTGFQTPTGEFIRLITCYDDPRFLSSFADPLAICVALDQSIVQESYLKHAIIELTGKHTRGMVIVNWGSSDLNEVIGTERKNVVVIEKLNMARVSQMLLTSVS
mmetsp:Transcript_34640/g.60919  ORF Transcript_34640/g.60919 Transcript_34640/m.60919 type:complete len:316 (+) Transcript_34640:1756-2703(+)